MGLWIEILRCTLQICFLNRSGRTVSYGYCVSLLIDVCSDNPFFYSVQVVKILVFNARGESV